jgi:heme exporter protein CcmD
MDWTASHAAYVTSAYAVSALALAGLTLWVVLRDKRLARKNKDDKP